MSVESNQSGPRTSALLARQDDTAMSTTHNKIELSSEDYGQFCTFLQDACGINLGDNKHYLVNSRLNKILIKNNVGSVGELLKLLSRHPGSALKERIVDAMTTNETFWFRDAYPFIALKEIVFPQRLDNRAKTIRIWSSACATGQEPYSIGIVAEEFFAHKTAPPQLQILGTDISSISLRHAIAGRYNDKTLGRGMSTERRKRFFERCDTHWQVSDCIKNKVQFRPINLLNSYVALGQFDVIFCRNVLIYFSSELKRNILQRLLESLAPGGYLFLGSAETIAGGYPDNVEKIRNESGVFYRLKG